MHLEERGRKILRKGVKFADMPVFADEQIELVSTPRTQPWMTSTFHLRDAERNIRVQSHAFQTLRNSSAIPRFDRRLHLQTD